MEKEGIQPENEKGEEMHFIPYNSGKGALYPVEGGMLAGIDGKTKRSSNGILRYGKHTRCHSQPG